MTVFFLLFAPAFAFALLVCLIAELFRREKQ